MDADKSKGGKVPQKESLLKHASVDLKGLPVPSFFEARLKIWEDLKQKEKEENAKKGNTTVARFTHLRKRKTSKLLFLTDLKRMLLRSKLPRWMLRFPFLRV